MERLTLAVLAVLAVLRAAGVIAADGTEDGEALGLIAPVVLLLQEWPEPPNRLDEIALELAESTHVELAIALYDRAAAKAGVTAAE